MLVRDGLAVRADVLALQDYAAALPQPVKPADIDMAWLEQRADFTGRQSQRPAQSRRAAVGRSPRRWAGCPKSAAMCRPRRRCWTWHWRLTDLGRRVTTALVPLWPPETVNGRLSLPVIARLLQVLQPT